MDNIKKYEDTIKNIREKLRKFDKYGVSLIIATNKAKYLDNVYNNFMRINYQKKELIIILNNNRMDKKVYKEKFKNLNNVSIYKIDENITLGQCLNFAVTRAKYEYVAKMDDDDYYGANYLLDLMNVFEYTDAQVVGKKAHFIYFEKYNILAGKFSLMENRYVDWVKGGTILFKKALFDKIQFRNVNLGEDTLFFQDCYVKKIKIFGSDKYNYVYRKHKDLQDHTWHIGTKELFNNCEIMLKTNNFEPYVDI